MHQIAGMNSSSSGSVPIILGNVCIFHDPLVQAANQVEISDVSGQLGPGNEGLYQGY